MRAPGGVEGGRQWGKKSLRRSFFLRFFILTIVPLTVLAVVVQNQYKKTINQQITDQLSLHVREMENLFFKQRKNIEDFLEFVNQDKSFTYHLNTLNLESLQETLFEKVTRYSQKKVKVYTYSGKPFANYNEGFLPLKGLDPLGKDVLQELDSKTTFYRAKFWTQKGKPVLVLSHIQKILGIQGRIAGYIEVVYSVDKKQLLSLSHQLKAELVFFDQQGEILLGSLEDWQGGQAVKETLLKGHESFLEVHSKGTPYAFISTAISWGTQQFLIGIGRSTSKSANSMSKVNMTIGLTYLCFFFFFIVMLYFFLKEFIQPIESLTGAVNKMKEDRAIAPLENQSHTEFSTLIDRFNEMSQQIYQGDLEREKQVQLLEEANLEIKKTQDQLVQTAKLASLGELVAGIAHELNNPIGFIYSNIQHLKDYSKSLITIISEANSSPNTLPQLKKDHDFEYILKDFPKLIKSCEEGAFRAKDIVQGLRNFSRSDRLEVADFDVNEGLRSTLRLLGSEIKNRIEVEFNLGELPLVSCHGNQIKQVFMNIISNACQAIEGTGTLTLTTLVGGDGKSVIVRIKDSGRGMSEEVKSKIFDPFFTTKEVGQGTGLGLSVSYGIMSQHHGSLKVASAEGRGSEFTMEWPMEPKV